MKTFVITLSNNKDSVKSTKKVLESAKKVGYSEKIELFEGILPSEWKKHLPYENYFYNYPRPDNVGACFASHYLLWKKCVELNEPILILEHDALFIDNIPDVDFQGCITFGRPSYIKPDTMIWDEPKDGVNPIIQINFLGHHAYAIKPHAAELFCDDVTKRPLGANDMWMDKVNYGFLEEYRPYPIIADTDFSTIQAPILVRASKDNPLECVDDPNDVENIMKGYKKKFPGLKCWEEGSKEHTYLMKYYSQTILGPQSKRFIDV